MAYVLKGLSIIILAVLCLALVIVGGLNIAKFPLYSEYYSMEEALCTNPGLNDGFVCQGICVSEENGVILVRITLSLLARAEINTQDTLVV